MPSRPPWRYLNRHRRPPVAVTSNQAHAVVQLIGLLLRPGGLDCIFLKWHVGTCSVLALAYSCLSLDACGRRWHEVA